MMLVDLKPLFGRLNPTCTAAVEGAAGLTLSRSHYEIGIEHVLRRLLEDTGNDVAPILARFEIDPLRLAAQIDDALATLKSGNPGRPVFASVLTEWIQDGWLASSITLGQQRIRSGALLVALASRISYYGAGTRWVDTLRAISRDALVAEFTDITASSPETALEAAAAPASGGVRAAVGGGEETAIARFCEDFTAKAAAGKIDPVFGRDLEIRQMVDILARRRKNNPIAVGDPGVGKTAVVEGLALRIIEGDVPDFLRNTRLLGLDMGLLEAGASVKGEFENRLRGVIDEIKAATQPTILFIDEAHMLIGAGGAAGGSDAANLLKPALARGELRTIAATTWAEYKKYFEKDPALARRFQLVKLDEPDVPTAVQILRGLKERYEAVHGVAVRDDAIVAAAQLSDRYITGRLLPDKAVDLLDTAAARVRISLGVKPTRLEAYERKLAGLAREQDALERDADYGHTTDDKRLGEIAEERAQVQADHAELLARWQNERAAARRVLDLRQQLATRKAAVKASSQVEPASAPAIADVDATVSETMPVATQDSPPAETAIHAAPADAELASIAAELASAQAELRTLQGDEALVFAEANPDAVAQVVSDWTGVPLGKVLRDAAGGVLALAGHLKGRIQGQDHAVDQIAAVLKAAQSGLRDPQQPLGVFLLAGPSGVGKTETALAVADQLFGGEHALTAVNMSEYQEKHTVSRLVGSPPGYVGYGEGGVLTEAVRKRPYSVVLLDEVEKAHLDVVNLFYQVFDKGTLADGEGRIIDFSNTVVFLTSNLATDEITQACANGRPDAETLAETIRPVLSRHFKPALLARMTIVPYFTLPAEALTGIVDLKLARVAERLHAANKVQLTFAPEVPAAIAARCTEVEAGARNIDFILRKSLLPRVSDVLLGAMAQQQAPAEVRVGLTDAGDWDVTAIPAA